MAFSITGQMKVSTLKKRFHDEFGLTLRVYDGPPIKSMVYSLGCSPFLSHSVYVFSRVA